MSHETDSVKCCNKGAVDLTTYWDNLQQPPIDLAQLKNGHNPDLTKDFMENIWQYNAEMAFGTMVLKKVFLGLLTILKLLFNIRNMFCMVCLS